MYGKNYMYLKFDVDRIRGVEKSKYLALFSTNREAAKMKFENVLTRGEPL